MKKFFSVIPYQGRGQLLAFRYEAVDNPALQMEEKISFPILTAINGYAQEGEEIRVITVRTDLQSVRANSQVFEKAVTDLCRKKGLKLPRGIEFVTVPNDDRISVLTDTFQELISKAEDGDDLYACLTYGTKLQPIVLNMAVQYAYRLQKNTSIGCMLYGKVTRGEGSEAYAEVFDMTLLSRLDELTRLLADKGVSDPRTIIHQILSV